MIDLTALENAVAAEETAVEAAIVRFGTLQADLAAAKAGAADPATIQALADRVSAAANKLASGTPAA